jgi:hypothetical protein
MIVLWTSMMMKIWSILRMTTAMMKMWNATRTVVLLVVAAVVPVRLRAP